MEDRERLIELGRKQGILLSPSEIEELKGYLEWDFSYLSFRDVSDVAMPIMFS